MEKTKRIEMNAEVKKAYEYFTNAIKNAIDAEEASADKNYKTKYVLNFDMGDEYIGPHGRTVALYIKKPASEKPIEKMTKAELIALLAIKN